MGETVKHRFNAATVKAKLHNVSRKIDKLHLDLTR
jgi:hypothetical protein